MMKKFALMSVFSALLALAFVACKADDDSENPIVIQPVSETTCTVTFNKNAQDAVGTMANLTDKKGSTVSLPANTFTRAGYQFIGWNTAASPTENNGISYSDRQKITLTKNLTLYAQWTEEKTSGTSTPAEAPSYAAGSFTGFGSGWNHGNRLDTYDNSKGKTCVTESIELLWGIPKATTEEMIKVVAARGFKTIRVPVSWHNHITDSNYTIDSKFIARVKEIVDWSLKAGLNVIINIHHDNLTSAEMATCYGFSVNTNSTEQAASKNYIKAIWKQVATYFKNYGDRLIFEIMNEPRNRDGNGEGFAAQTNQAALNTLITEYEQLALNEIRATGGNNATRYVMVMPYCAGADLAEGWTLPTDTATDKLIVSVHAYTPYNLCLSNKANGTTFGDSEKAQVNGVFNTIKTKWRSKGLRVVMGEASATDKENTEERLKWITYYYTKAKEIGVPVITWDNGHTWDTTKNPTGDHEGGECHGYLKTQNTSGTAVTSDSWWFFPTLVDEMVRLAPTAEDETKTVTADDPVNPTPGEVEDFDKYFEGTEVIAELADKATSWGTAISIPSAYAKRLQVGSRVYFWLAENTDGKGNKYLKFHVDNGNWSSVGVSEYFNAKDNSKLSVTEDTDNAGVYNSDEIAEGTYYFDVTETNLAKLKTGFALQGNLTVKKVGITNLAAETVNTLVGTTYIGKKSTFTATKASKDAENAIVLLWYERTAKGKDEVLSFSDVNLEVTVNGAAITTGTTCSFELDAYTGLEGATKLANGQYAPDDQKDYKVKIFLGRQIAVGDVVTVELKSAKVSSAGDDANAEIPKKMTATLVDISSAASYWTLLSEKESVSLLNGDEENPDNPVTPDPEQPAETAPYTINPAATYKNGIYTITVTNATATGDAWKNMIFIRNPNKTAGVAADDTIKTTMTIKSDKAITKLVFENKYAESEYKTSSTSTSLEAGVEKTLEMYGIVTQTYNESESCLTIDLRGNEANTTLTISNIKVEKIPQETVSARAAVTLDASVTALEIAKKMECGWNLGNTLDAHVAKPASFPFNQGLIAEIFWGQPITTKEIIEAGIKKAGYKTIRIPVTWFNHIINTNYTIDPKWMNRVKQVVNWAMDAGYYVILNEHHSVHDDMNNPLQHCEGYILRNGDEIESKAFLKAIWEQIAAAFNNEYDEHLIFETMNEPRNPSDEHTWSPNPDFCAECKKDAQLLNEYNQLVLDTIRASGGNNANRVVIIPPIGTQPVSIHAGFELPKDSATNKLMVTIHDYPLDAGGSTTWSQHFNDSVKEKIRSELGELYDRFISKGVPAVVGEYGAWGGETDPSYLVTYDDRLNCFTYFADLCGKYSIPFINWDVGDEDRQVMASINRWKCTVYEPALVSAITKAWKDANANTPDPTQPTTVTTTYSLSFVTTSGDISLALDENTLTATPPSTTTTYTYEWYVDLAKQANATGATLSVAALSARAKPYAIMVKAKDNATGIVYMAQYDLTAK